MKYDCHRYFKSCMQTQYFTNRLKRVCGASLFSPQLLLYVLPVSAVVGKLTLNLKLHMILTARLIISLKTDFKWNAGLALVIVCKKSLVKFNSRYKKKYLKQVM